MDLKYLEKIQQKRTKLRLKHSLNKTIEELKEKIKTYEINNNWDNIDE